MCFNIVMFGSNFDLRERYELGRGKMKGRRFEVENERNERERVGCDAGMDDLNYPSVNCINSKYYLLIHFYLF